MLAVIAGGDASDPLALPGEWDGTALHGLRDDALVGVRPGIVEAHLPP